MKLLAIFVAILLSVSYVSAEISFSDVSGTYNLGDKVEAHFNVTANVSADGLAGLRVICTSYELMYFLTPLQLSGNISGLYAPFLKISSRMLGSCFLRASVESIDSSFAELGESSAFSVTNEIPVNVSVSKKEALPGDSVAVSVRVSPSYGSFSGKGTVSFDLIDTLIDVNQSSFYYLLQLDNDVKSGEHNISVIVADYFDNRGSAERSLWVIPVASDLSVDINHDVVNPREEFRYYAELLDQAGDVMPVNISVKMLTSAGKLVFGGELRSGEVGSISLDRFIVPGKYVLKASAEGFEETRELTVSELEDIKISFDNRTLTFYNAGNIPYKKSVEIRLTGSGKDYIIVRDLSLKPNESEAVDLFIESKASGNFDVVVKSGNESEIYTSIDVSDERSMLRKVLDAPDYITGNVIGVGGNSPMLGNWKVLAAVGFFSAFLLYAVFRRIGRKKGVFAAKQRQDALEADRRRAEILEKRKLEEAKKHKYFLDKSLRERDDIKRFIHQQQERIKNK